MSVKVKHFYNPSYSAGDWLARNPILKKGEVGIELDAIGQPFKMKIGDGLRSWIILPYFNPTLYSFDDPVTNPIGDIRRDDVLLGDQLDDIIRRMVSPYQAPLAIDASNNASQASEFKETSVLEIGQSVDTSVFVNYVLGNEENLAVGNNIYIDAGGIFTNRGWQLHTGAPIEMLLANTLEPNSQVTYTIIVYPKGSDGSTAIPTATYITFNPTVIWGYLPDEEYFQPTITNGNPFSEQNKKTADSYQGTYSFAGTGYAYMLIPDMQNPTDVVFTEVSTETQPANYSMIDQGVVTVNNGTGTYKYRVYRSEFLILFNTKMRVS